MRATAILMITGGGREFFIGAAGMRAGTPLRVTGGVCGREHSTLGFVLGPEARGRHTKGHRKAWGMNYDSFRFFLVEKQGCARAPY